MEHIVGIAPTTLRVCKPLDSLASLDVRKNRLSGNDPLYHSLYRVDIVEMAGAAGFAPTSYRFKGERNDLLYYTPIKMVLREGLAPPMAFYRVGLKGPTCRC